MRKRMVRVRRGKGPAVEVYRFRHHSLKPSRFRYHGIVHHAGKKMQQRLGFRGRKVVEVAYVPIRKTRVPRSVRFNVWRYPKHHKKNFGLKGLIERL